MIAASIAAACDAEQVLATFGTTLRNELDLEQLREHMLAVVQETMRPEHVSFWLTSSARTEPNLGKGSH
jgi:hypothetical protein